MHWKVLALRCMGLIDKTGQQQAELSPSVLLMKKQPHQMLPVNTTLLILLLDGCSESSTLASQYN